MHMAATVSILAAGGGSSSSKSASGGGGDGDSGGEGSATGVGVGSGGNSAEDGSDESSTAFVVGGAVLAVGLMLAALVGGGTFLLSLDVHIRCVGNI